MYVLALLPNSTRNYWQYFIYELIYIFYGKKFKSKKQVIFFW